MAHLETVTATQSYRSRCEDRVAVFTTADRSVIVVADGAGGVGQGDVAAELVVREIESNYLEIHAADQWAEFLCQTDCRITAGETTVVVIDVRPYGIAGASVGDSQAWIIRDDATTKLTRDQNRKPLLGSGQASPVAFTQPPLDGVLFVATDGFFDYAQHQWITALIRQSDFYAIPRKCIELVRLPSGEFWDDIGIVVARKTRKSRARKRYSI